MGLDDCESVVALSFSGEDEVEVVVLGDPAPQYMTVPEFSRLYSLTYLNQASPFATHVQC